jgi:DNA-binding NtrC family response regulator
LACCTARRARRSRSCCSTTGTPGPTGAALIEDLRAIREGLPILVLTAQTSVAVAVDAMRAGATDFLVKPIAPDRLLAALEASTDRRRSQGELRPMSEKITRRSGLDEIVGSAPQFRVALAVAAKTARAKTSILIEGERGVGKDTLARAIHSASPAAASRSGGSIAARSRTI